MANVRIKVINTEAPGSAIDVNLNGKKFTIYDQKAITVPIGVLDILKNAEITDHTIEGDMEDIHSHTAKKRQRFTVVQLNETIEEQTTGLLKELQEEKVTGNQNKTKAIRKALDD